MEFCMSCGKKKRLRYPRHEPTCCSMRCAAFAFDVYASMGGWEGAYCNGCAAPGNEHCKETCPYAVEGTEGTSPISSNWTFDWSDSEGDEE